MTNKRVKGTLKIGEFCKGVELHVQRIYAIREATQSIYLFCMNVPGQISTVPELF